MIISYILRRAAFTISFILLIGYFLGVIFVLYFGYIQSLFLHSDWKVNKVDSQLGTIDLIFTTGKDHNIKVSTFSIMGYLGDTYIGDAMVKDLKINKENSITLAVKDVTLDTLQENINTLAIRLGKIKVGWFNFDIDTNVRTLLLPDTII
ncbi:hypothetical protein EIN_188280 [Entamoeba invadens IP1]|uniref:Late embryogenesis abundant protein LEA-2 subgroup domain-containing protein n=1 Tax=Entamoeba invadens IP1 TaxID=370355 RepID=L7FNQ8_ENTIV|nr:hypothetical protein EIN_188280 [Entamoeba invadens IP1]ELP92404.1 hypothetical protein EIN_188280 [Entamoeba invadens IP1]|eukprot:XP_004259175.1 hypothetical protein EIN_188280 [Entamoeba invadens IP1]